MTPNTVKTNLHDILGLGRLTGNGHNGTFWGNEHVLLFCLVVMCYHGVISYISCSLPAIPLFPLHWHGRTRGALRFLSFLTRKVTPCTQQTLHECRWPGGTGPGLCYRPPVTRRRSASSPSVRAPPSGLRAGHTGSSHDAFLPPGMDEWTDK